MSMIDILNLTFCYDGSYDNIFENVSFRIDTDWKLGFTGRNGRGKTTFLNLLMGKYEYSGKITASLGFDYFPFPVANAYANTIDVIEGICDDFEMWMLYKELSLLDVADNILERPFDSLSNGEQTKVLLCALFLKKNRFLLIDEPTNHLDNEARKIVGNYLNGKKGFILVSHDRVLLDECIDHILTINKTNIEIQSGNFSTWRYNKELQDNYEIAANEKLKKDIKRLKEAAERTTRWSNAVEASKYGDSHSDRGYIGHMSAKMMKRSKVTERRREQAVDEKNKLLQNIESNEKISISPLEYHSENLVRISNVSIFYGDNQVCGNVSFSVNKKDRIALKGKNGSGKSSILKLMIGKKLKMSGDIHIGGGLIISYVPQDTSFLTGRLNDYAEECGINESLFKAILRKLDFSRIQFDKDMRDFSGGQKKKVLIARSLCEKAHLYIWDEPLNFIDVLSRIQIEELLLEFKPAILFVEHDSTFVANISTKDIYLS